MHLDHYNFLKFHGFYRYCSISYIGSELLSLKPEMKDLQNFVVAQIPNRWEHFGNQLSIPYNILRTIASREDDFTRFMAVLHEWEKRDEHSFTWRKVIEVLESDTLKEYNLAHNITARVTSWYTKPWCCAFSVVESMNVIIACIYVHVYNFSDV